MSGHSIAKSCALPLVGGDRHLGLQLEAAGVSVRQEDCRQPNLKLGLYHPRSGAVVVCRAHRSPEAAWGTLTHEAAHRM